MVFAPRRAWWSHHLPTGLIATDVNWEAANSSGLPGRYHGRALIPVSGHRLEFDTDAVPGGCVHLHAIICITMKPHRIHSISIIGGFLDGVHLEFDTGLNCIIGARGTGKTTILELVRYVLDELPRAETSASARKRVDSLIEANLDGGRVEMLIETTDGLRYIITRSVGDDPIVMNEAREATALSVKSFDFFRADIFSQNEVETIADTKRFQRDLIDTFSLAEINEFNQKIEDVQHQVRNLARSEEPLQVKLNECQEGLKQLPMIEEKLKALVGESKDSEAEAVNQAHEAKARRDRETRAVATARQVLQSMKNDVEPLVGRLKNQLNQCLTPVLGAGANKELLSALVSGMRPCVTGTDAELNKVVAHLDSALSELGQREQELREAHVVQDIEFRTLIEKHKEHQAQSAERVTLERRRNQLEEMKQQSALTSDKLSKLGSERSKLLDQLSNLRDARFAVRAQIAERLTSELGPTIRVSISQDGETESYQKLIEEKLRGQGVQQGIVAQRLATRIPPSTLADIIRRSDETTLMVDAELNSNQAKRVISIFGTLENLALLETVDLDDAPTIELKDGAGYKDSVCLSTGQKCTTILPILLMESVNPLLIDQPEDNLDNRFVFETIVRSIQRVKKVRQLIFVTHNPNIPVLGDADMVIVMESDGEHGRSTMSGTVDHCEKPIVNLLEGGADAFRQRGNRYKLTP
jgi:DNA repair ATPase RecN